MEGIVHFSTIMKPEQRRRLDWLRDNVVGRVLEVGCSWGYALGWVHGDVGVDISPVPLELARLMMPDKHWEVADATSLPFLERSFDTVMLPEVLEHLAFPDEVERAIAEAKRVASHRILITVPDGDKATEEAECMKHQWLCDTSGQTFLLDLLSRDGWISYIRETPPFLAFKAMRLEGAG